MFDSHRSMCRYHVAKSELQYSQTSTFEKRCQKYNEKILSKYTRCQLPFGIYCEVKISIPLETFHHSFIVDVHIDKVWDFYTDLHHLEIITPKRLDFKIIKSSSNKITLGQTAYFSSKLLTRITWKTKITVCKPYTYVDEMSNTLFKHWKHTHVFRKINENQTKVTDEIEFKLQYGFIGKMFERYALDKLKKIFAHRQQATINALSNL